MSGAKAITGALSDWGPDTEGSTRASALMRLGLGCIALVRFGEELAPWAVNGGFGLLVGGVFFVFAAGMIVGAASRLSSAGLGATVILLYALGVSGSGPLTWGHHHVYLLGVACLLLSLTDCGRSFSLDRLQALRDSAPGRAPEEFGKLWGQRLIALQLSALYFWTAVDKSDWAFVSGQRLEQTFVWVHSGRALDMLLGWPELLAAASIAVLLVEYWLAVAILLPRWRPTAIWVGLTLHATFYLLLPVDTYSITMMVLYLALMDPAAVHRFVDRMVGREDAVQ
jgi:hypothetical protein